MSFTKLCDVSCDIETKIHNNQIARVSKTIFFDVVIDEKLV